MLTQGCLLGATRDGYSEKGAHPTLFEGVCRRLPEATEGKPGSDLSMLKNTRQSTSVLNTRNTIREKPLNRLPAEKLKVASLTA
jgi:hypothetical protein